MRKSSFCLKTDTLTITPSNTEDLWESDWIIAFRKGEKEQLGTATFAGNEKANVNVFTPAGIQEQGTWHRDHPHVGKLGISAQEYI